MRSGERKCELFTLWDFSTFQGPIRSVKLKGLSVLHWAIQSFGDLKCLWWAETKHCCSASYSLLCRFKVVMTRARICVLFSERKCQALCFNRCTQGSDIPPVLFFLFISALFNNADTVNLTPNFQSCWWLKYPFNPLSDLVISPVMAAVDQPAALHDRQPNDATYLNVHLSLLHLHLSPKLACPSWTVNVCAYEKKRMFSPVL